jgi:hypothetical protein
MAMNPERSRASLKIAPVPVWMRGLWRRRSIVYSDGRRDDTTRVYWLQTESAFADIRIPRDRPDLRERGDFRGLAETELVQLARQGGFAGTTELNGDVCHWHREIDFQPPTGVPDQGRLRMEDGVLIEEGVHDAYVEVWEPVDCGSAPVAGPRPPARPRRGQSEVLVVWGDVFMLARDRAVALPTAPSLDVLLRGAAGPAARAALLDCEISYGRRGGGQVPWEIQLSTVPFCEGRSLAGAWRDEGRKW